LQSAIALGEDNVRPVELDIEPRRAPNGDVIGITAILTFTDAVPNGDVGEVATPKGLQWEAMQNTETPAVCFNPEDGQIVFCNQKAADLWKKEDPKLLIGSCFFNDGVLSSGQNDFMGAMLQAEHNDNVYCEATNKMKREEIKQAISDWAVQRVSVVYQGVSTVMRLTHHMKIMDRELPEFVRGGVVLATLSQPGSKDTYVEGNYTGDYTLDGDDSGDERGDPYNVTDGDRLQTQKIQYEEQIRTVQLEGESVMNERVKKVAALYHTVGILEKWRNQEVARGIELWIDRVGSDADIGQREFNVSDAIMEYSDFDPEWEPQMWLIWETENPDRTWNSFSKDCCALIEQASYEKKQLLKLQIGNEVMALVLNQRRVTNLTKRTTCALRRRMPKISYVTTAVGVSPGAGTSIATKSFALAKDPEDIKADQKAAEQNVATKTVKEMTPVEWLEREGVSVNVEGPKGDPMDAHIVSDAEWDASRTKMPEKQTVRKKEPIQLTDKAETKPGRRASISEVDANDIAASFGGVVPESMQDL